MLLHAHATVLLTLLGSSALAANLGRNNYYPIGNQCSTQYGGYSVKVVPTSTSTVKVTSTKKTTVTPTTTVSGRVTTVTATLTATVPSTVTTSIPGVTATATTTTTVSTTATGSTVTLTETDTATTTTTVTTSSIVPTPAGFISAVDTIPGNNLSQKKRHLADVSPVRRTLDRANLDITPVAGGPPIVKLKSAEKVKRNYKQSYPIKVVCTTTTTTTVTATSTCSQRKVTVTKPGVPTTTTTTVTATTPVTVTQQGPSVTVTTTSTATSTTVVTPSVTETVTQTVTQTSFSYTATAYAACATGTSNNLVYTAGDNSPINGITTAPGTSFQQTSATSTSNCCSQCFADPQCAYSAYLDGFGCYLFRASSAAACNAPNVFSAAVQAVQPGLGGPDAILYGVSNGNCGQYNSVQTS